MKGIDRFIMRLIKMQNNGLLGHLKMEASHQINKRLVLLSLARKYCLNEATHRLDNAQSKLIKADYC